MRWDNHIGAVPALADDEVHVWQVALDLPGPQLDAGWQLLDPPERERAQRYRFARDRSRFVAGRGQLRAMLARYLGGAPAEVAFSYTTYGKPLLAGPGAAALHFNVAHSADRALIAICRSRPVGVDIEHIQPTIAAAGLAAAFFAPEEQAALQGLGSQAMIQTFFRLWACKEAYSKAHGQGLSLPLDRFAIALDPGPARLLYSCGDSEAAWQICELAAGADYVAALAVAGRLQLRYDP